MNTLPNSVQQLIYEYDNTYHNIYDEVRSELIHTMIINTRIGHNTYIADHIQINGIHRIVHNHLWGLGSDLLWAPFGLMLCPP
jgi:hypothetical protein